jgi:sulfur-oxidizing protein SoxX
MKRTLTILASATLAACAAAPVGERPTVTAADIDHVTRVMKQDFHARGQATMNRLELDEVQRTCNLYNDQPPQDVAKRLEEAQLKEIKIPSGSLIGNWQNGEKIAQNGRGTMWSDKPGVQPGGSCYNCHRIQPKKEAYGTIGPSLAGYGKTRGSSPEMQRYTYGRIFNSKAYNLCSPMPRLGHAGSLNEQQIKDLVGLLLDPASPVNQ